MLLVPGVQQSESVSYVCVCVCVCVCVYLHSFFFGIFPLIDPYRVLSRVPSALHCRFLLVIYFIDNSAYNLLATPGSVRHSNLVSLMGM